MDGETFETGGDAVFFEFGERLKEERVVLTRRRSVGELVVSHPSSSRVSAMVVPCPDQVKLSDCCCEEDHVSL